MHCDDMCSLRIVASPRSHLVRRSPQSTCCGRFHSHLRKAACSYSVLHKD